MVDRAQQASQDRSDIDDTVRFLFSYNEAELDRQGRMVIPALLRRHAELFDDMVVLGSGDRVEIWSREKWQDRAARIVECQACPGNRRRPPEAAGTGTESLIMEHTPVLLTQAIDGLALGSKRHLHRCDAGRGRPCRSDLGCDWTAGAALGPRCRSRGPRSSPDPSGSLRRANDSGAGQFSGHRRRGSSQRVYKRWTPSSWTWASHHISFGRPSAASASRHQGRSICVWIRKSS